VHINSLRKIKNLKNKIVFLRSDFNVPIIEGKIQDDYKISQGLETIEWLVTRGARVIIATHLAKPSGWQKEFSLKPIARRLQLLLKRPVKFLPGVIEDKVKTTIAKMKEGEIVMLENLRFYSGEYDNDLRFAKTLATGVDIYVNDAFAVSHRQQASVVAIKKYLPAYAGFLLEKELRALLKVARPRKPLVVVMGGVKASTKTPLISKLYLQATYILLGGAMANDFLKYQGYPVGRSLVHADQEPVVKKFFSGKKLKKKIMLPSDVLVQNKKGMVRISLVADVKKDECILDIGPQTIAAYADIIKTAQTLVWNGPLGKFEDKPFRHGTIAVATLIAARSSGLAYGLVGGGETVDALKLTKMIQYVDWISTAGGAMLTYLSGEAMPGLQKIIY